MNKPSQTILAGVDIGGTFTDLIWVDPDQGRFVVGKTLTTPEDASLGFETVLSDQTDLTIDQLTTLVHGSTLVTNAIIERKGARTALVTTEGFSDVLTIARQRRYDMFDLQIQLPEPLVPRHLCFGIGERILADGSISQPLDEAAVPALASQLVAESVEGLAICLLHGYRNPIHERLLKQLLEAELPDLPISISSDIAPEIGEYERASTVVANAYVLPIVQSYLERIEARLGGQEFCGRLYIMAANGGCFDPQTAARMPVRMIESGPAAGALAAAAVGRLRGEEELLSFDMGGTTAKACLIEGGVPLIRSEFETDRKGQFRKGSGLPIRARVVDMVEIGAGGGSLAVWDSTLGRLRVGPLSAGADPGPIAYGRGGTQPTVTDADLVLGYLNADYFLGGEIHLDQAAATQAIAALARIVGGNTTTIAAGIHQVVNENMAAAAHLHAVERGKDPRQLTLYAFGGAGPVHAYAVGRLLRAQRIVVPFGAGAFSALGLLSAPLAFDLYQSHYAGLDEINWDEVAKKLESMEAQGREQLEGAIQPEDISAQFQCEMRYRGQAHQVQVPFPAGPYGPETSDALLQRFEQIYRSRYLRTPDGVPAEVLTWGVRASGPLPDLPLPKALDGKKDSGIQKGEREVYWPELGVTVATPVYDRYLFGGSASLTGPAIIEERESTTVVGPGAKVTVDRWRNLVIDL